MKKFITVFLSLTFLLSLTTFKSNAQIGSVCDSAHVVSALPFTVTGLNTATSGNNYNSLPCTSFPNYMSGNDYLFTYTALYNHNVKISLANTAVSAAVFVTSDCPNVATACVAQNMSTMGNPVINSVSLTAGTTYYIIVSTVGGISQTTLFDIEIVQLYAFDAAVTHFITPVSNCGLTNSEEVKIRVKNQGTQNISNFELGYSINGVAITPETITATLNAGDTLTHIFTQTADLSVIGTYLFEAYVVLQGDEYAANDTFSINVAHQDYVNTLPYIEDFENGNGGWTAGGSNSTWQLGTPAGTVINTPATGGTNSWVTNLTGNHHLLENSYVLGPCFDFSNYQNVSIKMDIFYQTSPMMGGAQLQASINGGASWFLIGDNNEPTNWYNGLMTDTAWTGSSYAWLTANHHLNFLGGQSNVRLRIAFKTGMMPIMSDEGFAFDNIIIYECTTLPTSDFTLVQNGNTVTVSNASQDATGYLWNFGDQMMAMLPDTNTNTAYTYMNPGTYNITLAAFNDCGVSYSSQTVTITLVDVNEVVAEGFSIYPNPANEMININCPDIHSVKQIQIFDILGQEVFKKEQFVNSIDIKKLSTGIYQLKITNDRGVHTKKFIKE